jgi:hypothetical protein
LLISSPLELQDDSSSCGVWLQVARDCFIAYIDSDSFGSRAFFSYMQQHLAAKGVVSVQGCRGQAKRKASQGNLAFILSERADMRARLLRAAMEGKLVVNIATLAGFTRESAIELYAVGLDSDEDGSSDCNT